MINRLIFSLAFFSFVIISGLSYTYNASAQSRSAVAVSESSRFPAAAEAYWECAPQRAIETVSKVLQKAQLRGEVDIDDPAVAARQFVAMLRGDVHLEILFGLRSGPDATEIQNRVTSAVDVLLNGALASAPPSRMPALFSAH